MFFSNLARVDVVACWLCRVEVGWGGCSGEQGGCFGRLLQKWLEQDQWSRKHATQPQIARAKIAAKTSLVVHHKTRISEKFLRWDEMTLAPVATGKSSKNAAAAAHK